MTMHHHHRAALPALGPSPRTLRLALAIFLAMLCFETAPLCADAAYDYALAAVGPDTSTFCWTISHSFPSVRHAIPPAPCDVYPIVPMFMLIGACTPMLPMSCPIHVARQLRRDRRRPGSRVGEHCRFDRPVRGCRRCAWAGGSHRHCQEFGASTSGMLLLSRVPLFQCRRQ